MGIGSLAASIGGYVTDNLGVSNVFAVLGFVSALSLLLVFYIIKTTAAQPLTLEVAAENSGERKVI
jgi:predicted MFS family arabinose efflux permease